MILEKLTQLHAMLLDGDIGEATRLCDQILAEAIAAAQPQQGENHG